LITATSLRPRDGLDISSCNIKSLDLVGRTSDPLSVVPREYLIGDFHGHTHTVIDLDAVEFFTAKDQVVHDNLASLIITFTNFVHPILRQPVNSQNAAHYSGIWPKLHQGSLKNQSIRRRDFHGYLLITNLMTTRQRKQHKYYGKRQRSVSA